MASTIQEIVTARHGMQQQVQLPHPDLLPHPTSILSQMPSTQYNAEQTIGNLTNIIDSVLSIVDFNDFDHDEQTTMNKQVFSSSDCDRQ